MCQICKETKNYLGNVKPIRIYHREPGPGYRRYDYTSKTYLYYSKSINILKVFTYSVDCHNYWFPDIKFESNTSLLIENLIGGLEHFILSTKKHLNVEHLPLLKELDN